MSLTQNFVFFINDFLLNKVKALVLEDLNFFRENIYEEKNIVFGHGHF